MQLKALTIVLTIEEGKPPTFTLVGNLTVQEAYLLLHDFMIKEARQQGQEEAKGVGKQEKIPERMGKPTQRAPRGTEGEPSV